MSKPLSPPMGSNGRPPIGGRRPELQRRPNMFIQRWRGSIERHDDDDPPPCPAAALPFGLELERRRKWDALPEPLAA